MLAAVAGQNGKLVFEQKLGIVEQTADQGRLAVINGTAGQKAQHTMAARLGQALYHCGAGFLVFHQK